MVVAMVTPGAISYRDNNSGLDGMSRVMILMQLLKVVLGHAAVQRCYSVKLINSRPGTI